MLKLNSRSITDYKYVPEIIEEGYKVHMKLTINLLGPQDYGIYRCISKNSLGDMEGTINVYRKYCLLFNFLHNYTSRIAVLDIFKRGKEHNCLQCC